MDSYIQIAITIINAAIMTWLGVNQYKLQKRQTELQRRQTEAQEYEIYRRLYVLLVKTHDEVNEFLTNVNFGTWESYVCTDKELLKRKESYINQLRKDLFDNYVDYELKFSQDLFDKDKYRNILYTMYAVLFHMNQAFEKDEVTLMHTGSFRIPNIDGDVDKGTAISIAKRFKHKELIFDGLMNFIAQKRELGSCEEALKVIKEKCKID
jgi:hypothetical protein